ncbi:hypothetical protein C2E21_2704 [Chlorella sorokiniana]|uniref:ubiquitinyl hydrolase 1 n=1 Tax=Chlorella sorokiniana TaxID=3076 RepID=A0A2P6TX84_CHLSO|nr:hypothetical protein C2E21_2704 [Chlorella sorokiniana]|eukprot:PRW58669.1 hypothetical protein C2E21_2704 [Chlorella sorokiniana]
MTAPPAWACEEERLLASIYRFNHTGCSSLQDSGSIEAFLQLWRRLLERLQADERDAAIAAQRLWPGLAPADLERLQRAVDGLASAWSYGEYGCLVVPLQPGQPDIGPVPGSLSLLLVGLDSWRWDVHSTDGGGIQHTATCDGSSVLCLGQVASSQLGALRRNMDSAMAAVAERKGDARSAAIGRQGHQKPPAMVAAALRQALAQTHSDASAGKGKQQAVKVPECLPQGGFTDVGLHTGGLPRDTAWPLVREAVQAMLSHAPACRGCATPDLFQLAEAHLHLWLMQRQVALLQADTATAPVINAAMLMLGVVASRAAALAQRGHSVQHFEAACTAARAAIEAAQAARVQAAAEAERLPPLDGSSSPCGPGSWRLPCGTLPPLSSPQRDGGGQSAAEERQGRNLGCLPLLADAPNGQQPSFAELLAVLRSSQLQGGGDLKAQHALCLVERALFGRVASGSQAAGGLGEQEVAALVEVVEDYRTVLHAFQASPASHARMQADLRSRCLLVGWVALCLVHAAAGQRHPLLLEYEVGVSWQDLRHLVLSDKPAEGAMLAVAAYLRRHTKPGKAVFSLADGGQATFELAARFSAQDHSMQAVWREEQAAAGQRADGHWAEVRWKQEKAAELRALFKQQRQAEKEAQEAAWRAEDDFREAQRRWVERNHPEREAKYKAWVAAKDKSKRASNAVATTDFELQCVLVPPAPVIQPLPKDASTAHAWLFFLYMPPLLRQLARLTFLAQQLLLPPVTDAVRAAIRLADEPRTSLVAHYNSHQSSDYLPSAPGRRGSDGSPALVLLQSGGDVPTPDKVRLPSVDNYTSPQHGVWHPDALPLRLCWRGSGSPADGALAGRGWFDPWAELPSQLVVEAFTEALPEEAAALQWAMPCYGSCSETAPSRGSQAIARQDERPHWLSKPAFLAFGSLRAYGALQGRRLAAALHERALPWGQPAVASLVRQALYHVGPLTDEAAPQRLWRTDWRGGGEGSMLPTLCAELSSLAGELENTPREHSAVLLLGEVAAYLSDWHPPLREVARRFAAAAARWAEELEGSAAELPPERARALRAKQCLLRCTALLCRAAGQLSEADVEDMLGLAVLVHHGSIYAAGTELKGDLEQLQVLCHWALARRINAILAAVEQRPAILTAALRRVLQRAPTDLKWARLGWRSQQPQRLAASFQAHGSDGCLYAINCLDGTVLEDGAPPGRLPREVLDHPLYRRSFGSWGFEVSLTAAGLRRTIAPVRGCFYEFYLAGADGSQLVVTEAEAATGRRMQLLDPGSDLGGGAWGSELPPRLRELHSHWLDREARTIVLRPVHFRDREMAFILQWQQPPPQQPSDAAQQQQQAGPPVSYVCRRVPAHLPHRIPRAAASRGCSEQLQRQRHGRPTAHDVLLPVGRVVRGEEGVEIEHGAHSGDSVQTHILEVHPRFGHLCARSIPARLQLAALYAATGSLLPEPLSRLTGAQQAMALLRQCWGVRPLSAEEVQLLQDVAALGGAQAAGLRLLAHELLTSAASLTSLRFPPPAEPPEWCRMPELDPDWLAAYEAVRRRSGGLNPRLLLTAEEEQRRHNPFLSDESVERLQHGACTWLQLCVLEDRLQRLERLAEAAEGDDDDAMVHLAQELAVHRSWSVEEHPHWLAFEAEQQQQIRPQQHWVAAHLMANWGHIVQLNMGEGKTRVVVPMLVLNWANGENLVRLTLLPALLEEAYEHLHCVLSASALRRRLFVLPFHRDVQPTAGLLGAMHAALVHCQQSGGVLLTTPERRLSLHLKQQELWEQGQRELVAAMSNLAALPYVDLLDESDELLTHRFQLIYAWGSPTELPSHQARARACQALLRTLSAEGRSGQLGATLAQEGVAVASGPGPDKPGGFRGVRLLSGAALEQAGGQLRCQLAQALLADPPYAMRWMRHRPLQDLLRWVTDPTIDARSVLATAQPPLSDDEAANVLALRGLLACGVLEHCLTMRHLVDFGLDSRPTARKRLAVPYRAAHVPSERSEYAQPDTALTLTQLAFYHRGLLREQLLDALRELLRLGLNAQRAHYDEWLALARADVPPEEHDSRLGPLDSPAKLDTSNAEQVEALHALFSHSMAAIDFYLNFCVFPSETRQYASRLVATAWDLAGMPGSRVVGFSGTNDSHRLLPLALRQQMDVEPRLRGTNGHMLAVLLANPRYDTLAAAQGTPFWEVLLRFAVQEGVDAVIDCGALLAGVSSRAAADFLLSLLDRSRYWGVCYFDEGERQWVVCDLQGRRLPRHCSPIREAQACTLFDEARCRGADLQLRPDAQGLLTLGPATCKDKLMQAAGRMRRLGKGQRLRTVATADVTAKLARLAGLGSSGGSSSSNGGSDGDASCQLSSRDVLAWAMSNTVAATQRGVLEWAHQGMLFATTHGSPEHAVQPEVLELADMYGDARNRCAVPALVEQHGRQRTAALRERPLPADMRQLLDRVVTAASQLGAGHKVVTQGGSGFGEECERELEREEEEEAEEERQVPRATAVAEADWDYAAAMAAPSLAALQERAGLQLLRLRQLAAQVEPAAVGALPWSPWVWATANYAQAVQQPAGQAANEYLRPVGELLLLPAADDPGGGAAESGSRRASSSGGDAMLAALLLSEREASGLLEAVWAASSSRSSSSGKEAKTSPGSIAAGKASPLLVSLCYAAAAQLLRNGGEAPPLRLPAAVGGGSDSDSSSSGGALAVRLRAGDMRAQLVSLQLWDGETSYADAAALGPKGWEAERALPTLARLRRLVVGQRAAAEALVAMRGKAVLFGHSQLERACDAEGGSGGGANASPASP